MTATVPRRLLTLYLPLSLAAIVLLFPFYWMLITSIKTDRELIDLNGLPFWVFEPTLEHYRVLFAETGFLRWALNTLTISVVATAISLLCSILAGYALARLRFRGRGAAFATILLRSHASVSSGKRGPSTGWVAQWAKCLRRRLSARRT